jgi:hypothetical protein
VAEPAAKRSRRVHGSLWADRPHPGRPTRVEAARWRQVLRELV